ncbi:MAG: lipase maturation factor family protein, partial [Polyangiales bacterium]
YVAPHQPRVDFRLWFYGLSFGRGMPRYVDRLLDLLCRDPSAVQPLFATRLPAAPSAVRIAFYRYHMSSAEERARSSAWFTRELLGHLEPRSCVR